MFIAYYIYDGMTFWWGRANDGTVTQSSSSLSEIRSTIQKIEDRIQPQNGEYAGLNIEPIQSVVRMERGEDDQPVDLVEGFTIIQALEGSFEFFVFSGSPHGTMTYVETASSLERARYIAQKSENRFGR